MTTQLMIYEQIEAVNNERHIDWSIKDEKNYSFAKNVNSVPLLAVEFPNAMDEYTIVFAGENENLIPMAIIGINQDQNLYIDSEGGWKANYIPAFIRRYPFVFATDESDETLTLCLDESFTGCNQEDRGERLFDSDGEKTQYLENVLEFLKDFQEHHQRTQIFCEKLNELDLFEEMNARFTFPDGEHRTLTGFKVIKKEKLKAIPQEELNLLFDNDGLELIYLHMHSMRNLNKVIKNLPPNVSEPLVKAKSKTKAKTRSKAKTKDDNIPLQ